MSTGFIPNPEFLKSLFNCPEVEYSPPFISLQNNQGDFSSNYQPINREETNIRFVLFCQDLASDLDSKVLNAKQGSLIKIMKELNLSTSEMHVSQMKTSILNYLYLKGFISKEKLIFKVQKNKSAEMASDLLAQ